MTRWIFICLVVVVPRLSLAAESDSRQAWLTEATSTYQQAMEISDRGHRIQQFAAAEALFAKVVAASTQLGNSGNPNQESVSADSAVPEISAELYVNLGNAALGAEHLGPAILAYRRALKVDPNHSRAKQNLEHARTLVADWVPKPEEEISLGSFFDWAQQLKNNQWRGFAGLLFLLAAICGAAFIRLGSRGLRTSAIVLGVLWLIILVGTFMQSGAPESFAVVTVPETTARSADSIRSPARFPEPLPSGTELQVIEDRGDWLRVRMFDGREVWIASSALDFV